MPETDESFLGGLAEHEMMTVLSYEQMWASHQFTCGKLESTFTVPPLSLVEVIMLKGWYDTELRDGYAIGSPTRTLYKMIKDLGLFKKSYKRIVLFNL